jgi:DNA-binding transcriptional LysR family regulator
MDIRSADLNLLVALDALVRERSVTRAGERMGLSQPAMSNVLGRLRRLLGDPVLVRTSRGMVPTQRVAEVIGPVREALAQLQDVLAAGARFEPSKAERIFRVAAMDHAWVVLVPHLVKLLAAEAPRVRLDLLPYGDSTITDLESGGIDAAILAGRQHGRGAGFQRAELYDDNFDCLLRRNHPGVGRGLTLKRYLELGHVLASPRSRRGGLVDQALQKRGLSRRVHVIVPHFAAAPFVVAQTDLVATLPRGVARPFAKMLDLRLFPPPIEFEAGPWFLVWHERTLHDSALAWLRERITDLSQGLRGST